MEKGSCETAQFSSDLSLLLACGVGEVLELAGIQLLSTGCSRGAGWQSLLSVFYCPRSVWLPLTAAAAPPLPPGPGPGLAFLPVPGARPRLATVVPEVV